MPFANNDSGRFTPRFSPLQTAPAPTTSMGGTSLGQAFDHAFDLENGTLNFLEYISRPEYEPEEGYNFIDDIEGYEDYGMQFFHSRSRAETLAIKSRIDNGLFSRRAMEEAGLTKSLFAYGAAGILSVENFIPGLGLVGIAGKGAVKVSRAAATTRVALQGGAAAAIAEVPLRLNQQIRTGEESLINVVAAVAVTGGLGTAIHAMGSAKHAAVHSMAKRVFNDITDQVDDVVVRGIHEDMANGSLSKLAGMQAEDQADGIFARILKVHPEASKLADGPGGINWLFRAVTVLTRNPVMRMARSKVPEVRMAGMFLMNNPLLRAGQLSGEIAIQPIDSLIEGKFWTRDLAYRVGYQDALQRYAGPVEEADLGDMVTNVVRGAEVDPNLDEVTAAFVKEQAAHLDEVIEWVRQEGLTSGAMSEFEMKARYISRVYNIEAIKANEKGFLELLEKDLAKKIADDEVRSQVAKDIMSDIMQRERGHHHMFPPDKISIDDAKVTKERRVFTQEKFEAEAGVSDLELSQSGFLINDPKVIVQRLYKSLGPRVELNRKMAPITTGALVRVTDRARRLEESLKKGAEGKLPVTPEEVILLLQQVNDLRAIQVLSEHGFQKDAADLSMLSKAVDNPGVPIGPAIETRAELEGITGRLRKELEAELDAADAVSLPGQGEEGLRAKQRASERAKALEGELEAPERTLLSMEAEAARLRAKAHERDRSAGIKEQVPEPPSSLVGDQVITNKTLAKELGKVRRELDGIRKRSARDAESLKSLFAVIRRRHEDRIRGTTGRKRKRAEAAMKSDLRDLKKVRDRLLGIRSMPEDAGWLHTHVPDAVRSFNYFRLGANFGLNSIPDTGNHFAVSGMAPVGIAFREWIGSGDFGLISKGKLQQYFLTAELVANARAYQIADITDGFSPALNRASELFAKSTGLSHNNAYQAAFASLHVSHNILDAVRKVAKGQGLSKVQRNALATSGIDDRMAKRIYKTWTESIPESERKHGTLLLGQSEEWVDVRAREAFETAVISDVRRAPVTPGVGDRPRFFDEGAWGLMGQFRSFTFATTTKILLPALQRGEIGYASGFTVMASFGMLVTGLRLMARGEELPEDPAWWVLNGLDRGGFLGLPGEYTAMAEKVLGVGPFSLLTDDENERFRHRGQLFDTIIGPAAGAVDDGSRGVNAVIKMLTGIADEDMTPADRKAFWKLLPYQNAVVPPVPQLKKAFIGKEE